MEQSEKRTLEKFNDLKVSAAILICRSEDMKCVTSSPSPSLYEELSISYLR